MLRSNKLGALPCVRDARAIQLPLRGTVSKICTDGIAFRQGSRFLQTRELARTADVQLLGSSHSLRSIDVLPAILR
jgi:hypothetical protein